MGFLDSNFRKVEIVNRKNILTNENTSNGVYNITPEVGKEICIEISVTKTTGDAKISFTGTSLQGVAYHWIEKITYDQDIIPTNNKFTLPVGTTRFTILQENADLFKKIKMVTEMSGDAKISISYWFEDVGIKKVININSIANFVRLQTNKIYKISTYNVVNTESKYTTINLMTKSNVWLPSRILTEAPMVKRNFLNVLQDNSEYYIDARDTDNAYLNLLINGAEAGGTGTVTITEIDELPKITNNILFSTSESTGNFYYNLKPSDKAIKLTVWVNNLQSGKNFLLLTNDVNDTEASHVKFRILGTNGTFNDKFIISSNGVFEIIIPAEAPCLKVSSTLVTGTQITVEAIGIDTDANLDSVVFENKEFVVEKHISASKYARYENWESSLVGNELNIRNGIDSVTVLVTDFPNWKTGDVIEVMGFIPYKQGELILGGYSRETSMRLCVVTKLGNIYHNYPADNPTDSSVVPLGIGKFDLSAIYQTTFGTESLSSERIPSENASLTLEQQKTHRYEPGLPAWNYTQHTDNIGGFRDTAKTIPYGNGGHPPVIDKGGYKHIRLVDPFPYGTNPQNPSYPHQLGGYLGEPFVVKPKMTLFVPYVGINFKRNMVLGTTDGGRTWYVLHELGIGDFMYKLGNSLDYSSIGAYNTGELSVVERVYNDPTDLVKEPVNAFKYKAPVTVSSISTSGGKTTVTTSIAHGITDGRYIVFKKNVSGNYDFLENTITYGQTTTFDSNSVGNGRFYTAKVTGANTFELLQNLGGADEKIKTHHIHGGSTAKDGAVISCGEIYPNGWICYVRIPQIDDFENVQITAYKANNPYIIRLNSSEEAVQRPVGFILNDDMNQTFLFGSDEAHIDRGFVAIEGRTTTFKRNSAGIFRGETRYIDDMTKVECILEMEEASLGIVWKANMYVVIGMSRYTYFSADLKTWYKLPIISMYVGESDQSTYIISSGVVYKITRK